MRYLVTGGAGFIGSFVVDHLLEQGHDVVVIDNLDPAAHASQPDYLASGARYHWSDVRDPATWEVAKDCDAIAHLAGKVGLGVDFSDTNDYVTHNDLGTAMGLTALHELGWSGRFVLASSMVVYGEGRYRCAEHGDVRPGARSHEAMAQGRFEPPCPHCGRFLDAIEITEDTPTQPRNVYAATKLHQEHLCSAFEATHPVEVSALRFHNVYGPRMPQLTPYAGVASIFLSALAAGRAPRVYEDGGQTRDFVHVRDVSAAVVAALTVTEPRSGAFNVASGEPRTVLDMATALAEAVDPRLTPEVLGGWRDGDVRHVIASPEKLRGAFDLPTPVAFADGIRELATAPLREPPSAYR